MRAILTLAAVLMAVPAQAADDPYLWLESIEGAEAMAWVKGQNEATLGRLQADDRYQSFFKDAQAIYTAKDRIPYGALRGGQVYNFWQDKKHVRGLWRRTSLDAYGKKRPKWETVLDLDALAKREGENWVYKGVECLEPTYERCMVRLSRGGKDASVYREYDVVKKAFVDGGFMLPEAKSSVSWVDRDTLYIGTNWGEGTLTKSGYARTVRLWKRGTPLASAEVVFEGEDGDVGVWPWVTLDGDTTHIMAYRSKSFFTAAFWYRTDRGLVQLPLPEFARPEGIFKGELIARLRSDWTVGEATFAAGSLISAPVQKLVAGDTSTIRVLFAPDARSSVRSVTITKGHVYLAILDTVKGALLEASFVDGARWETSRVDLPTTGALRVVSSNPHEASILVNYEDFLSPDKLYRYEAGQGTPKVIRGLPTRFKAKGVTVEQHIVKSKDGTEVPYFLVKPSSSRGDGTTPTLLYGYGGFEVSMEPRYMATFGKLWLERGGAFAIANIRGGGEFGPAWHQAAKKTNRQRAYDDFLAIAEDLIDRKVTRPEQLGIMGGSNGGLLMGAAFTQRPDLFGAVVCQVPLLDMLRYTKLLAGASWIGEYGDPEKPEMREYILTYSPYQNLDASASYPEVFFITSTRDDRVHPGHARKMAAKMVGMGKKVLYFENIEGGHAASANQNQRAQRLALEFVYLWQKLGSAR